MKILSLIGARPQFVKEALVGSAVREKKAWRHILVHSGQHYDANMSDVFFAELGIPQPEYHLGIGSGLHGAMTAAALAATEEVLLKEKPDALIVYGDTNTTLAGALAAAKLHIPIIHVEAGIRMLPRTMPEEINRVLTDRIAAVMCCCSELGRQNLVAEGLTQGVHVTGDVMYDLFCRMRPRFTPEKSCAAHGLTPDSFVLATLHRDYNVDDAHTLEGIVAGLEHMQRAHGLAVFWPVHPRAKARLRAFGLAERAAALTLADPLGYLDLMSLLCVAAFTVTDSGGLQKEAYYAQKRSMVVMPDTGWRELTDAGWNVLTAPEAAAMEEATRHMLAPVPFTPHMYGDGQAAAHIVDAVLHTI